MNNKYKGKTQYYGRLSNTLARYGITWAEHRSSPAYLFRVDESFRHYWYSRMQSIDDAFVWFTVPTTWREEANNFDEIYLTIANENPQWASTGTYINYFIFL